MKRIISLMLVLMLAVGMMSVAAFADGAVTASKATSAGGYYAGTEFTVTVAVNKGGYAGLQMETAYGENLTLVDVEMDSDLKGYSFDFNGNVIWINCETDDEGNLDISNGAVNTDYTGDVAVLKFKVNADAAVGTKETVSVTVKAVDAEENIVISDASAGVEITVEEMPFVKGDINGDGNVNIRDVVKLKQYIKNTSGTTGVVEGAVDINGDGNVNIRDVVALKQYIKAQ